MPPSVSDALAALQQFTDQLLTRLDSIRAHFLRLDLAAWQPAEALHRLVHGLTGSAGSFGMQSVSDALEIRLADELKTGIAPIETAWYACGVELDHLDQMARMGLQPACRA